MPLEKGLVVFQLHSLHGIYYQGKQFTVNTLFSGLSTNLNRSETNPHRSKRLFRLVPLLIPFANSSEPVRFFSIKVPCSVRTKLRYRQAEQHLCFLIGNLLLERTQFSFESQAFDEFWQELSDIGFRPPTEMNCNSKIGQKLQLKTLTMSGVEGFEAKNTLLSWNFYKHIWTFTEICTAFALNMHCSTHSSSNCAWGTTHSTSFGECSAGNRGFCIFNMARTGASEIQYWL